VRDKVRGCGTNVFARVVQESTALGAPFGAASIGQRKRGQCVAPNLCAVRAQERAKGSSGHVGPTQSRRDPSKRSHGIARRSRMGLAGEREQPGFVGGIADRTECPRGLGTHVAVAIDRELSDGREGCRVAPMRRQERGDFASVRRLTAVRCPGKRRSCGGRSGEAHGIENRISFRSSRQLEHGHEPSDR
jgi:hypothetical protein